MITNYPKKVAAPHIGANGNWFLGKEDTGVKASGQSTTEILPVTISPEDWDAATNQVIIDCEGVSINEEEQVVTLSPALNSKATCTACEIKCVECNNDNLTLQATTLPTEAVTIYVAITKAGGAQSSGIANNVYSTEETVVGTWINGKPVYRRTFIIGGDETAGLIYLTNNGDIDELVSNTGYFMFQGTLKVPCPYCSGDNYIYTQVITTNNLVLMRGGTYKSCFTTSIVEYTKTTDIATIEIPSVTAMTEAYEEGVNEA